MPQDKVTPPDPAVAVHQLLAAGHSPQDIIQALAANAMQGFEFPKPELPTLLPRRARVARYTIRVDLDGSQPKIWRRIAVPSDVMLDRLHTVLQAAMGWTESHLHAFQMGPGKRDHRKQRFVTAYDIEEGDEGIAETDVRLDQTLGAVGDRLFYEYDFGDGWDHTLRLEAIDEVPEGEPVATLVTGGRRACPPEDVGGIHSYNEVVAVMAGKASDDEWMTDQLEWMPEDFDPAEFDLEAAADDVRAAAAGTWPFTDLPFTHPELVEMLLKLGPLGPFDDLLAAAADGSAELSPEEIAEAVRPLSVLLELVGEGGTDLTPAGYLKPVVVEQLARDTGITRTWIGKANREDLTPPVANLRATAQSLGLIRKYRQRLLLTPAGRKVREDPQQLWELLVAALPAGQRPEERQAGLIALLTAATGRPHSPLHSGGEVLANLGWRVTGGPVTDDIAYRWARPTRHMLNVLDPGEWRHLPAGAAALARAALRPRA